MAGIINVNSNYNSDTKKVTTKLSFEVGESFTARVVNQDKQGSEVILKLTDGWQFNAKLENPLEFVPNGLVKFVVEGFQGEQLLIKLVPVKSEEAEQNSSMDSVLKDQNLNLSKEDFALLEKMVKNNIPLTRENISSVKTLVDFKNKLELNQGEKDAFINKYINSKGIDIDSIEGKAMKESLDSFFKELKNIDTEDLLALKENNIEVTDENLKSFNKLFKEPKAIYKSIMEVKVALENEKTNIIDIKKENISSAKTSVDSLIKLGLNEGEKDAFAHKYINSKGIDIGSNKGKVMKESLNSLFKEFENIDTEGLLSLKESNVGVKNENISSIKTSVDAEIKPGINEDKKDAFIDKYINSKGIDIDSSKGKVMKENLNSLFKEFKNIDTEGLLSLMGNNIEVTDENLSSLKTSVDAEIKPGVNEGEKDDFTHKYINSKDIDIDSSKGKVMKESLNSLFKEFKNIDTEDLLSLKGNNLGATDENAKESLISNKAIKEQVENKTSAQQSNTVNSEEKDLTSSSIVKQGKGSNMLINDKDTSLLVKEQIAIKTDQLKDVIKNLIQEKANLKPEAYDKLVQNIKGNINDFKVFNSVSNQYYYLDMPLKVRDEEYDCKIMIKDDRKKDKSIDTKNVKLVITVNTGNMGIVDSYIKANNKNMNIDIKCEESWVKVLSLGKDKILKGLENSDYSIQVSVGKKQEDANLTNCADFFNDVSINSINTRA